MYFNLEEHNKNQTQSYKHVNIFLVTLWPPKKNLNAFSQKIFNFKNNFRIIYDFFVIDNRHKIRSWGATMSLEIDAVHRIWYTYSGRSRNSKEGVRNLNI